jgi:ribosome production factor 2
LSRKAKTARGRRFLDNRESKVVENTKSAMFIKGTTTSRIVNEAMADLVSTCCKEA